MKKILLLMVILLISMPAYSTTIDLSSGWTAVGSGNWTVATDGQSVYQSVNTSNGTFFHSSTNYLNTEFNGKFKVESGSGDDDFIGFVFGYNGTDDFYLFDWKKGIQLGAQDGFTLSKITDYSETDFWVHTGTGINVLASDYGTSINDRGWVDNTEYAFNLFYQNNRIKIAIDGGAFSNETIFDVAGTFATGNFGFYNYSQPRVTYQGFEEDVAPPTPNTVPEPATMLLFGIGLLGLTGVNRKKK